MGSTRGTVAINREVAAGVASLPARCLVMHRCHCLRGTHRHENHAASRNSDALVA